MNSFLGAWAGMPPRLCPGDRRRRATAFQDLLGLVCLHVPTHRILRHFPCMLIRDMSSPEGCVTHASAGKCGCVQATTGTIMCMRSAASPSASH